ncbi:hypothetical protein [Methanoplanus endosymbiosus]|uniref:Uncharacterized protein n=1 Tax=Methanoplanus endosymbiosus TaxID=33865 RepID=A0A9E7TL54_9EURY|nr:hypothetical protein [Methanoplanus endosymbiosus]UUX93360.1 hypothetical protein L6E24_04325 [Methanoplanus endosymbiosus]
MIEDLIEDFIREYSGEFTIAELRNNFPEKISSPEFEQLTDALKESNKIGTDADGYVIWIYNPEIYRKYAARDDLRVR